MNQTTEKETVGKASVWPQWIAGVGGLLLLLQLGMMTGWSSPYIAQLTSAEYHITITMTEASWVVSLLSLGRFAGAIICIFTVNYFGTKTTILITSLPVAFCWILTILANRVEWLYAARSLAGISVGMIFGSFLPYLGEIAESSIRGALVALSISGLTFGNLLITMMGAYLTMDVSASVSLAFCIVLVIIFIYLPESPYHLIKMKQYDKARASILWYHRSCDVDGELQILKKFIETNNSQTLVDVLREFKQSHVKRALLLVTVLFMYSMTSGLNNLLFYMEIILRSARVNVIKPALVVSIVNASGIVGSLLSMLIIDKFGRRIVMIVSALGCTLSMACLSVEFQLLGMGYDAGALLQSLPIVAMLLFQNSVQLGMLPVPNAMLCEIFSPRVKSEATCFINLMASLFSFISTSTYQPLIDLLTEKYVFFLYALLNFTAIPYTYLRMPETKGKSLQQIQEEMTRKS